MQLQDLVERTQQYAQGAERWAKEAEHWRRAAQMKDIEIQSMKMNEKLRIHSGEKSNDEKEIESPEHEANEAGSNSENAFQFDEGLNNSSNQMDGRPPPARIVEPRRHTSLFDQIQSDELLRNPEVTQILGENEEEIFGKAIT